MLQNNLSQTPVPTILVIACRSPSGHLSDPGDYTRTFAFDLYACFKYIPAWHSSSLCAEQRNLTYRLGRDILPPKHARGRLVVLWLKTTRMYVLVLRNSA